MLVVHFIVCLINAVLVHIATTTKLSPRLTKVWGPGLKPDIFATPARYFFIQAVDHNNISITAPLKTDFDIRIEGRSKLGKICRLWTNILDRKDGSFIVRYKVYEACSNLVISVKYNDEHVGNSPYQVDEVIQPEDCYCPVRTAEEFLKLWECKVSKQLEEDLFLFKKVNWDAIREKVIKKYDSPGAISLCHYIIKDNEIYNKCYGKYVGFKMFIDAMLLSLHQKALLPDLEFFVNLGDWPLVKENDEIYPIFSWCGSTQSYDIVMPTYGLSEATLENMGKVTLDMLSVQGNVEDVWENRIPKLFWRGRDSNKQRLKLMDIAKEYPELFNVSLTNYFFYRELEEKYGKSDHVSFFKFMDYKYQLNIDGTVAAYRFPFLLAGGSLVFKQTSKYYEHFYNELIPYEHFIPVKEDLSDLVEKILWAKENDETARKIAKNGQHFANDNLLPKDIYCYYANLLNEFSKRVVSPVRVLGTMEKVEASKKNQLCDCISLERKDEL